jgi:hypothetical protein
MIADVGGKIIEQFSACLSEKLAVAPASPVAAEAQDAAPAAEPAPETEPLDLVHYARASAVKRAGPLVGVAMLVLIIGAWLRRVRSRSRD